jgi:Asp-tRNA(Asn)/Glu-tRNA(Gln) amidotransferase B subunit
MEVSTCDMEKGHLRCDANRHRCWKRGAGQEYDAEVLTATRPLSEYFEQVANPKQVEQYKSGKGAVLGFLVGQVIKATRGQANPAAVNQILQRSLS